MARGIDFSSLTRAERAVLAAATLLFADGVVPWWYRVQTPDGRLTYNAGLTGWGVVAVAAAGVAAVGVLARASIWPDPAPRVDGFAYTALGTSALLALLVELASARGVWIGLWVALPLAVALTLAGLRRAAERRAGWT